jgi:hypothetical protein
MNTLAACEREHLARVFGKLGHDHLGKHDNAGRAAGLERFPRLSYEQRSILLNIVARLRADGCTV